MKRKTMWLLGLVLAVGLIAGGCGDDDDDDAGDGGEALSKEDYLAQGNEICREGDAQLDAAGQALQAGPGTPEFEAFVTDDLIPNIQGQIDQLREGIPEGDEDTVNGILDEAELALVDVEEDPSIIGGGADPFAEINPQLDEYGLTACGGG